MKMHGMAAELESRAPAPRILLARLSAIGDIVHGLPVLCALRARWPHALLVWVVEKAGAEILHGHRALDEIITLPRGWLASPRAVWRLRQRLRQYRFDTAIDLQGLTKSAAAVWLSGARQRIGFGGENSREISRWFYTEIIMPTAVHVVEQNLELLRPLGVERPAVCFDLPQHPAAAAKAEEFIRANNLTPGFAVINPGAGWLSKRWPAARFAAVARHLGKCHGLHAAVTWGGEEELRLAQEIAAAAAGYALVAPATNLPELIALLRRSRLCIASDTGPLHIAAALGVRCIGLYGPMPAERNGPYGQGHVTLQRIRLSGSSRERRQANPLALEAIAVDDVCCACDEILAAASG